MCLPRVARARPPHLALHLCLALAGHLNLLGAGGGAGGAWPTGECNGAWRGRARMITEGACKVTWPAVPRGLSRFEATFLSVAQSRSSARAMMSMKTTASPARLPRGPVSGGSCQQGRDHRRATHRHAHGRLAARRHEEQKTMKKCPSLPSFAPQPNLASAAREAEGGQIRKILPESLEITPSPRAQPHAIFLGAKAKATGWGQRFVH